MAHINCKLIFAGQFLNDLLVFNPATLAWADLSFVTRGPTPSQRYGHGFQTAGGLLYIFGGQSDAGFMSLLYKVSTRI